AVAAVLLAAPENLRIVPACPLWLERGLLLLAGLWFVNLVNFMDGLDLMTVAESVPVTRALVLPVWLAELPAPATDAAGRPLRATDNGFPVWRVVSEVFALNILLAALAIGSTMTSSTATAILFFIVGGIATALLMHRFSRRQSSLG